MTNLAARLRAAAGPGALALLLALFVARALDAARVYNHTVDELAHMAPGVELWQFCTFTLDASQPPLARALVAAPVFAAGLRFEGRPIGGYQVFDESARLFEPLPDGAYWACLRLARAMVTAVAVVLLAGVYEMGRRHFGAAGAIAALAVASGSPGIVGHAAIAATDLVAVATLALALFAFRRLLESPTPGRSAWFGAASGLAVAAKLSAIPYLGLACPTIAGCLLGRGALAPLLAPRSWVRTRRRMIGAAALSAAIALWAAYGFGRAPVLNSSQTETLARALAARAPGAADVVRLATAVDVPLGALTQGLGMVWRHSQRGHPAYLAGSYSLHGWPHYFAVTTALKTPIGTLVAVALSLALAAAVRRTPAAREVLGLGALGGALLVAASPGGINIGHRHFLVIEVVFALMTAGGVRIALDATPPVRRIALPALIAAAVAGASAPAAEHPDAVGYTNALAGEAPDRWLADSNIDWGQDLARASRWLRDRGVTEEVWLAYFGNVPPGRCGLRARQLPPGEPVAGWIVASATVIRGVYAAEDQRDGYGWLLSHAAEARIGTSIRIYHLPGPPAAPGTPAPGPGKGGRK